MNPLPRSLTALQHAGERRTGAARRGRSPVSEVIETLHRDHGNLVRLVRLLDGRISVLANPEIADVELVVNALEYLTHFPDVSHHPLEDRIVDRLRDKRVLPFGFAADLMAQHSTIARQGHELAHVGHDVGLGQQKIQFGKTFGNASKPVTQKVMHASRYCRLSGRPNGSTKRGRATTAYCVAEAVQSVA